MIPYGYGMLWVKKKLVVRWTLSSPIFFLKHNRHNLHPTCARKSQQGSQDGSAALVQQLRRHAPVPGLAPWYKCTLGEPRGRPNENVIGSYGLKIKPLQILSILELNGICFLILRNHDRTCTYNLAYSIGWSVRLQVMSVYADYLTCHEE